MGSKWTCPRAPLWVWTVQDWNPGPPQHLGSRCLPYCHHHIFSSERPHLTFLALGLGCRKAGHKLSCRYWAAQASSRFECCTRDHPLYLPSQGGKYAIEITMRSALFHVQIAARHPVGLLPYGCPRIIHPRCMKCFPAILWEGMQCPQDHRLVQQQFGTRGSTFVYSLICYNGKQQGPSVGFPNKISQSPSKRITQKMWDYRISDKLFSFKVNGLSGVQEIAVILKNMNTVP